MNDDHRYRARELDRIASTTFYRLQVSSDSDGASTRHLNISDDEKRAIRDVLAPEPDTFRLTISTGNAAFDDDAGAELARILHRLADTLPGRVDARWNTGNVMDTNGNTVGAWSLA